MLKSERGRKVKSYEEEEKEKKRKKKKLREQALSRNVKCYSRSIVLLLPVADVTSMVTCKVKVSLRVSRRRKGE